MDCGFDLPGVVVPVPSRAILAQEEELESQKTTKTESTVQANRRELEHSPETLVQEVPSYELPDPRSEGENLRIKSLERFYRLHCSGYGRELDRKFMRDRMVVEAMAKSSMYSAAFTSRPLLTSLTKPPLWIIFGALGAIFLFSAIESKKMIWTETENREFRHLRFQVLELRGGLRWNSTSADTRSQHDSGRQGFGTIQSFGVILSNWRNDEPIESRTVRGPNVTISFNKLVRFNGWYLKTSTDSPQNDPVKFRLLGSQDLQHWVEVDSTEGDWRILSADHFKVPVQRDATLVMGLQAPIRNLLVDVIGVLGVAWGCLGCIFCAMRGKYRVGKRVLICGLNSIVLLNLVCAFETEGDIALCLVLEGLTWLILPSFMLFWEKKLVLGLASASIGSLSFGIFISVWHAPPRFTSSVVFDFTLSGLMAAVSILLILMRLWVLRTSIALLSADRTIYDEVWASIKNQESVSTISGLTEKAELIAGQCNGLQVRQVFSFLLHQNLDSLSIPQALGPVEAKVEIEFARRTSTASGYSVSSEDNLRRDLVMDLGREDDEQESTGLDRLQSDNSTDFGRLVSGPVSDDNIYVRSEQLPSDSNSLSGSLCTLSRPWHRLSVLFQVLKAWLSQRDSEIEKSGLLNALRKSSRKEHGDGIPVKSFDQLFAQARILRHLLRECCCRWALDSDGLFQLKSPKGVKPSFVQWREASRDAQLRKCIKWPQLKSPERALEKTVRNYR
mmetsp:Transcript_26640/g.41682  ORF Transcript_26640/g.41682 Transcript_26640/m.41682 type:complete len:731 (+) Transcript_26640:302-2494(+)